MCFQAALDLLDHHPFLVRFPLKIHMAFDKARIHLALDVEIM